MAHTDENVGTEALAEEAPLYVYGVVASGGDLPEELAGVSGSEPVLITSGDVAAVVSPLAEEADFGTPDDLVAHTAVLDGIAQERAVLPMRFGTVVPNRDALQEEVLAESRALQEQLDHVTGTAQYTLRVRYDRDTVIGDMLRSDPRLAELQEVIAGTTEEQTRDQRIELGEGIVKTFDQLRSPDAEETLDVIRPHTRDTASHDIGQADDVLSVAVLVAQESRADFERAVESQGEKHHPRMRFRLVGPQAPYDFVGGEL